MSKMKWFMKQYWRIGQTRALLSLAMGMLSLGRVYVESVPVLSDWGFWGAATLGVILIFVFLGIGWLYDVKARLWTAKMQSTVERDVYRYLPNFKTYAIDYPTIYSTISTLREVFKSMNLSTEQLDDLAIYMSKYFGRNPERKDILESQRDSKEFIEQYPFQSESIEPKKIPFMSKVKVGFTTNTLRLTWIQELTGMLQDALVFAAVYVVFIFPGVAVDGTVPLFFLGLGFIILSIPLLLLQTSLGWFYDKRLRVWSVRNVVEVERNPYTYVAFPRQYTMELPFYYAFLEIMKGIFVKLGIDTGKIDAIIEYIDEYGTFRPSREGDFAKSQQLRREFGVLFNTQQTEEAE